MKIIKKKLDSDLYGHLIYLDKDEKFEEMIAFKYKVMKDVIKSHKTMFGKFNISSGKLVLTSIGSSEVCIKIMWSFPIGNYDAFIENNDNFDSIFIPFRKFNSETVRYHLFFNTVLLPDTKNIPLNLMETNCLPIQDVRLFVMDEADWSKYKSIVYSGVEPKVEETLEELNKVSSGKALMIPFELSNKSKSNEDVVFKKFYFAYCGYTLDGDPAYLWFRKRKFYDDK